MTFLLLTLLSLDVQAQEEPIDSQEAPTLSFEELGWVPPFQVGAFLDRAGSGDCDRIDARYGRCIELVDFYQPEPVWQAFEKELNPVLIPILYPEQGQLWVNSSEDEQKKWKRTDKKTAVLLSQLYAQTWEDLVYRWKETADPMAAALSADGFKVLPSTVNQWETVYPSLPSALGRPHSDTFLTPSEWVQPIVPVTETTVSKDSDGLLPWADLQSAESYYARVKWAIPDKYQVEPTSSIVLSGRFASRLAVKGRLHDYDLMDADPKASGPFFEQIYPYQTIYQGDNPDFIPLMDFRYRFDPTNGAIPQTVIAVESLEQARILSDKQFNKFYRMVGAQVMQFAMQDYTANHMRILATLNTMRSPPGELGTITGISGNINAASMGQTDSAEAQAKRIKSDAYSLSGGFSLNYQKIPDLVILKWIERLSTIYLGKAASRNMFLREVSLTAQNRFGESLVYPLNAWLEGTTTEEINGWIGANLLPGRDGNVLLSSMYQLTLQMLMDKVVPEEMRSQEETWLLMDHYNFAMMSNMDTTPGVRVSPLDLESMASEKWEGVLSDHFFSSQKIDQGLGAVDPTAVCTQGTRLDALSETTVGAVYVDQVFKGKDIRVTPNMTNDALLWEARHDLPFIMFDNPVVNAPSVQRLVGLPDDEALYRVRWIVWSGWHFLWGMEAYEGKTRLTLKTGAICDNLVLASPDLVPTIVRAGFLVDEFYPTQPARSADKKLNDNYPSMSERQERRRQAKGDKQAVTRGDVLTKTNTAVSRTKSAINTAEGTADVLSGEQSVSEYEAARLKTTDASTELEQETTIQQLKSIRNRRPAEIDVSETVQYFRRLARSPMVESSKGEGLLLLLHDLDQPEKMAFLHDAVAHTPYARAHKLQGTQHIQGAGWAVYFGKESSPEKMELVAPNYVPRASYIAKAVTPSFQRVTTTDATFVADVGLFPYRQSFYTCNQDVNNTSLSSVEQCDPSKEYIAVTDGVSIGASSLVTKWFRDDPRLAYEVGLEMHLDVLHAGKAWFYQADAPDISIVADRLNGQSGSSRDQSVITPSYTWSLRPQTGASFGIRHSPDPSPLSRTFRSQSTWGAMAPSGSTHLNRTEWGLRGAFLVGPSFNGMEGTLVAEAWAANLIRNPRSDWANFSPYHPIFNGGVFLRYQRGGVLVASDTDRVFDLLYSDTYVVGWRTHFRLPEERPEQ